MNPTTIGARYPSGARLTSHQSINNTTPQPGTINNTHQGKTFIFASPSLSLPSFRLSSLADFELTTFLVWHNQNASSGMCISLVTQSAKAIHLMSFPSPTSTFLPLQFSNNVECLCISYWYFHMDRQSPFIRDSVRPAWVRQQAWVILFRLPGGVCTCESCSAHWCSGWLARLNPNILDLLPGWRGEYVQTPSTCVASMNQLMGPEHHAS